MGNRDIIEHDIALITKIHEYLLKKLDDYENEGLIDKEQLNKIISKEEMEHEYQIKVKQSYIWED